MHRIVRSFAILGLLALAGCKEELYSGLPEQEANKMISLLAERGITANKSSAKDGSKTIIVGDERFAEAVTTLTEAGYPHKKFESLGDVFKSGGLVPSPTEERARLLYAIDQELSATISQIDGVLSARVEVVLPENDLLSRTPSPSSASVFVRYKEKSGVDHLVPQLKTLVASSVQGLAYDRVSVVLVGVAPRIAPPPVPPAPLRPWALALAALAGGLAVSGFGALAFRFAPKPLLKLARNYPQEQLAASTTSELVSQ
jgi:type III secretion protein J